MATDDAVPGALDALAVRPSAARESGTAALLTVRRRTADASFYYLFNQRTDRVADTVRLEGEGRPYLLDTWTGEATPVTTYRRVGDTVVLPVALAGNDQQVVVLTDDAPKVLGVADAPAVHATATDADEVVRGAGAPLAVRATTAGRVSTTLSDGRTVATDVPDVPAARTLDAWSLSVERWERGASGAASDTAKETLPTVDVRADDQGRLPAWSAIAGLEDASGVGTYRTTLRLDGAWTGGFGARLDLGRVVDAVRVTVNGRALPPVDPMDPTVDLGPYLHGGDNAIEVRVASTLLNAVRATDGTGAGGRARQDYGLIGPVRLEPYGEADVDTRAQEAPAPAPAPSPSPTPAPAPSPA
ncbi:hypothetical protein ACVU7I_17200, partial [Patulibacter sp. S7RM1-6]